MLRTILLLNPVYVSLFWAIVLSMNSGKSNVPKVFLGKVLGVGFILYVCHFLFFSNQIGVYKYLDSVYTLASLSMPPLYYIYVLLLTRGESFSVRKHGFYLILPIFVFAIAVISVLTLSIEVREHYYGYVLTGTERPVDAERFPYLVYLAGRFVFILQVFVYMFLVNREVSVHNSKIEDYYSDLEERSLGWIRVFNVTYFLASIAGIVLALLGRERFINHDVYLIFPSLVFSTLYFIISYLGYRQKPTSTISYDHSANYEELNENSVDRLSRELITLFETNKYFLNRDFKILDICAILGSNRTYVSRVINQKFGVNFTTFVNNYRVEYAKGLFYENKNLTVEELAELSGFGSVNSLYRAFESREHISLGTFRKRNQ